MCGVNDNIYDGHNYHLRHTLPLGAGGWVSKIANIVSTRVQSRKLKCGKVLKMNEQFSNVSALAPKCMPIVGFMMLLNK